VQRAWLYSLKARQEADGEEAFEPRSRQPKLDPRLGGGTDGTSQQPPGTPRVKGMTNLSLNNKVEMPALGLGVFQTPPDETRSAVEAALATGYRHIDTVAAYGNEREVGEAVRRSGVAGGEIFLETKVWISDYGYDESMHAFEKSAAKLGVNQIELHPYFQQREVQALDAEHSILTRAWSPIGGITFYRDGNHATTLEDPVIGAIAESHGKSPAQVKLRWHLQEGRSVIPKSTKPHRIAENFDVFDFDLTNDDLVAIDGLDTDQRGGPEPSHITLESFGRPIPEA
jgi:diketogulonate reductase-like aldo/keto reductase